MSKSKLFHKNLKENAVKAANRLNVLLPPESRNDVTNGMRYAVLNGGKRLRAFLAIESSRIFDVPEIQALQAAAAIECIHSYSLVHDDLPAMDNDDIRRGVPTVHKKWNDATAILVGDGLQSLSFEILSNPITHPDPKVRLSLVESLAKASGANGMVAGQAMDMNAEKKQSSLSLNDIIELQNLKTGELIVWSAEVGARLASKNTQPFTNFAKAIGLAFQIQDDILDLTGDKERTGKTVRKDCGAGKATFVSLLGLEEAKSRSAELVSEACETISCFGKKAFMLQELAKFTINRLY
tara:strand:+ start:264 stop:1151 length:888 start_codon:yes stop_codon:yes gene_type:complete